MLNRILLVGRLTRQPEAKATSSGIPMVLFSLAVNRKIKENEYVTFFDVVAFNAMWIYEHCDKGDLVYVEGEMRQYKDSKGRNRYNVIANRVVKLSSPRRQESELVSEDEDVPF